MVYIVSSYQPIKYFGSKIVLRGSNPSIKLSDTVSGGRTYELISSGGKYIERNVTDGRDEVTIDPSTSEVIIINNVRSRKTDPAFITEDTASGGRTYSLKSSGGKLIHRNETDGVDEHIIDPGAGEVKTVRNIRSSKTDPKVILEDTASGGRTYSIVSTGGVGKVVNESDGVDELTIDPGAGRASFARTLVAPILYGEKKWSFDTGSVSLSVGTGDTPASTTMLDITDTDFKFLLPLAWKLEVGGTVASGETVTVEGWVVDDAGNEYGPLASYSVTGATGSAVANSDFTPLLGIGDGKKIVKIIGKAASSATSTSATANAQAIGIKA